MFHLSEVNMHCRGPITRDIRMALNVGTTLTTRFWLSLTTLLYGVGFYLQSPSWLAHPAYEPLNAVLPLHTWGSLYAFTGLLGLWRVLSPRARPWAAWTVNFMMATVWAVTVSVRWWGIGPVSLASVHTVLMLMALWCNTRTEATIRDRETA